MKFKIERYGIVVIPENEQDRAYIEDTLGLKHDKASMLLVRRNAMGVNRIADLVTDRPENRPMSEPKRAAARHEAEELLRARDEA